MCGGKGFKELIGRVEGAAVREGAHVVGLEVGGKHGKLKLRVGGREVYYVLPLSPGRGRTIENCVSGIRRLVRQTKEKAR